MNTDTQMQDGGAVASKDGLGCKIGDLVNYKKGRGQLRCGCGSYDRAVVASVKPFVLISEFGDMRWTATVNAEDFEKVGEADRYALMCVVDRLSREYLQPNEKLTDAARGDAE